MTGTAPKLAGDCPAVDGQNAKGGRLPAGLTKHLRETEKQVQRLERIGEDLGIELDDHT